MPIPRRSEVKLSLIALLRERGSLTTTAVYRFLADEWNLSDEERREKRSGGALYQNEIRWARQDLALAGILERPETSGRAVWTLRHLEPVQPDDYDDEPTIHLEGTTKRISVNAYERNKKAREECLKVHGYSCVVCDFNFETAYGEAGKECIHVHHLTELSSIKAAYQVNPRKDLVPICPNCHYVVHRRRPAYTIDEVRSMLRPVQSA